MSATTLIDIVDGPTAGKVWDHAKYSQDDTVTIPLEFTMLPHEVGLQHGRRVVELFVDSVSHDNGSGQSLNIGGYYGDQRFTGLYNARTRKGFIDVES